MLKQVSKYILKSIPGKSIRLILTPLLTMTFLLSCDPVRILQIKVLDKPNYSVTIFSNKNILPGNLGRQNEELVIQMPTKEADPKYDTTFYYGLGVWPGKKHMPEFSKDIDSIIIIKDGVKTSFTSQNEISRYLVKHRHGVLKRILTITAK